MKGAGGSLGTPGKDSTATASSGRKLQRRFFFDGFEGWLGTARKDSTATAAVATATCARKRQGRFEGFEGGRRLEGSGLWRFLGGQAVGTRRKDCAAARTMRKDCVMARAARVARTRRKDCMAMPGSGVLQGRFGTGRMYSCSPHHEKGPRIMARAARVGTGRKKCVRPQLAPEERAAWPELPGSRVLHAGGFEVQRLKAQRRVGSLEVFRGAAVSEPEERIVLQPAP